MTQPSITEKASRSKLGDKAKIAVVMIAVALPALLIHWTAFLVLVVAAGILAQREFTSLVREFGRRPRIIGLQLQIFGGLAVAGALRYLQPHFAIAAGLAIVACDIMAQLVGVAIGGHVFVHGDGSKLLVSMSSPNKSWEGVVGGVSSGAVLFVFVMAVQHEPISLLTYLMGTIIAAAAVIGDLSESKTKRSLQIKDTAETFGPHGGALDRLDSISNGYLATGLLALAAWYLPAALTAMQFVG